MAKFTPSQRVSKLEVTNDTLTGRGGILLFCRYLESVGVYNHLIGLVFCMGSIPTAAATGREALVAVVVEAWGPGPVRPWTGRCSPGHWPPQ